MPVGFGLISTGPRYIPATEVAPVLLLETVLGALFVWMAVGEAPTLATVVGGVILVVVLAAHSVATLRSREEHPPTGITT